MKHFKSLVGATALLFSVQAQANYACSGKVTDIDLYTNGGVGASIEGIGGGVRLCSVIETEYSTHPETCKVIYSTLLTAKATGSTVRFYFNKGDSTVCSKGNWKHLGDDGLFMVRLEQQ